MVPPQGTGDADSVVEIEGLHFLARVTTDFKTGTSSEVNGAFRVLLRASDGSGVERELTDVHLSPKGTLLATVPAGIPRGIYDLLLTDPRDQKAELSSAYRVVTSAEHVDGFRFDLIGPQRARVPFQVAITAIDASGHIVDGFAGNVTLSDKTGSASPASVGPFVLGASRTLVTVTATSSANALMVTDALGHSGASADFEVKRGLMTQLKLIGAPATVQVGACSAVLEVEVQDSLGFPAEVESPFEAQLSAGPTEGLVFHSSSACSSSITQVSFAPGSARAQAYFRGEQAGALTVRAMASALPAATVAVVLTPAAPQKLRFASNAQAIPVSSCSGGVRLETVDGFENPSAVGQDVTVNLSASPPGGFNFYTDSGCSTAATALSIPAGSDGVTFYFRGAQAGTVTISAAAQSSSLASASQGHVIGP
jgi:hypothetical protein